MEFWDHGDPAVDQFWRKVLGGTPDEKLADKTEPEGNFEDYVPPELRDHGTLPDSLHICEDIWDAS